MEESRVTRWFVTADFLNRGIRGVFCNRDGEPAVSDVQHTEAGIQEAFGPFWVLMNGESTEMEPEALAEYTVFVPLEEYKNMWGLAYKADDYHVYTTGYAQDSGTG